MLKLLIAVVAFIALMVSDHVASAPIRRALIIASLATSISFLVHGVVVRRRKGESWNEALASGSKLITGNVWLDGFLFFGVLVVIAALVYLAFLIQW